MEIQYKELNIEWLKSFKNVSIEGKCLRVKSDTHVYELIIINSKFGIVLINNLMLSVMFQHEFEALYFGITGKNK